MMIVITKHNPEIPISTNSTTDTIQVNNIFKPKGTVTNN